MSPRLRQMEASGLKMSILIGGGERKGPEDLASELEGNARFRRPTDVRDSESS
jgi:hypothetical protein